MRILGTGIDYSTGEVLIDSIDEETFGQTIVASLARHADQLRSTARTRARGAAVRGEVERERTVDLGDPRAAGWTFLVNRDDPRGADIEQALGPLGEHRGMSHRRRWCSMANLRRNGRTGCRSITCSSSSMESKSRTTS